MDSAGNEVIIVDDRAQTNGFNGNYSEEVSEMKTRSKAATMASGGPGEAAKLRSSSRTNAAAMAANVANSLHKNDDATTASATAANATGAGGGSSSSSSVAGEKDKKMSLRSGVPAADGQPESAGIGKFGDSAPVATAVGAGAGAKKSAALEATPATKGGKKGSGSVSGGDREDDSGINSRSSSVSTDDTYSSRLRTRSKRTEPPSLSSSTPASARKTSSRMPLSTYDFDDDSIILEEDATSTSSSASSLKRKATKVLVEEMDEEEEEDGDNAATGKDDDDEPPVKVTRIQRGSFFSVLINPLKAIRGKLFVAGLSQPQNEKTTATTDDVASQTSVSKIIDDDPKTEHVASQTDHNSEATASSTAATKENPSTCMVM